MIDLTRVRSVLTECQALVDDLHGLDLDDSRSVSDQTKGAKRQERAKRSQELQMLATRFELAAALTRIEFWTAKGEVDPLNRRRDD